MTDFCLSGIFNKGNKGNIFTYICVCACMYMLFNFLVPLRQMDMISYLSLFTLRRHLMMFD